MKKLYTLLITALTMTTASATMPAMMSREQVQTPAHRMIKKPMALQQGASITGKWMYDEYRAVSGGGWSDGFCYPEIVAGDTEGEVIIKGFWVGSDENGTPLGSVKGTWDANTGLLTIPMGQYMGKITTRDGYEVDTYMYLQDWNNYICYDDPLVLQYDYNTRSLSWICDMNGSSYGSCLIVTNDPDGFGKPIEMGLDFIVAIEMYLYNGYMTANIDGMEGSCVVYAEQTDEGFKVDNLGAWGFGAPLTFTVDREVKKVNAPATIYMEDAPVGYVNTDVYYAAPDGGDINGSFTTDTQDGSTVSLVSLYDWCLYSPEYGQPVSSTFANTTLMLPFDLSVPSAVQPIAGDYAADAQYYSLQGVKLANPQAGSIVIERRGGETRKVVVR